MSGLDRDGWPSADTVLVTERKKCADLIAAIRKVSCSECNYALAVPLAQASDYPCPRCDDVRKLLDELSHHG